MRGNIRGASLSVAWHKCVTYTSVMAFNAAAMTSSVRVGAVDVRIVLLVLKRYANVMLCYEKMRARVLECTPVCHRA